MSGAWSKGCCGFFDSPINVGGRPAQTGCDYGHKHQDLRRYWSLYAVKLAAIISERAGATVSWRVAE
jgi:hypothetical protein